MVSNESAQTHPPRPRLRMITMNRKTRATHRFRGAVAGVVATVMMFGLADLIARAFTPSAAPLLTLGQAIIPLAPPAAIKPVIALFGDNDKLVLVVSTGLGALIRPEAGAIGAIGADRKSTRLNSSHTDSSRMPSSA